MASSSSNVWVIDDDRSIRWVLERALEQAGMTTMTFDNGDAMLQRLSREQPDVIISDIRMPGIDGIALLERVHHDLPKLPVIIMTAHSDLESAVSSYQSGAFDYLPKPFDVDDAMAMVRRAVTHAHEQKSEHDPGRGRADRDHRPGTGDAGGVSRHRTVVSLQRHGADQRRIGQRQGTRRARAASAQPARRARRSSR